MINLIEVACRSTTRGRVRKHANDRPVTAELRQAQGASRTARRHTRDGNPTASGCVPRERGWYGASTEGGEGLERRASKDCHSRSQASPQGREDANRAVLRPPRSSSEGRRREAPRERGD